MKRATSHIRIAVNHATKSQETTDIQHFVQNYRMKTVTIVVCVLAVFLLQTTATAQFEGSQQNQIIALHSNKCVDVSEVSTANGQAVQQWQCFPQNDNQNWAFEAKGRGYIIKARHSGKCLDVKDFQTNNGAPIIQWDCHGSDNQLWTVNEMGGGYQIKSVQSGKCLDVRGPSVDDGAQMQIWDCVGPSQTNQLFKISSLSSASTPAANPAAPSQVVKLRFQNVSPRDMDVYFDDQNGETHYLATVQSRYQLTQSSPVGVRWHVSQDDQWKATHETTSEPLQVIRFGE